MTTPHPDQIESHLAALLPSVRALLDEAPPEDDVPVGERSVPAAEFLEVLAEQVAAAQSGVKQWQLRTDQQGAGMLAGAWRSIVFGQAKAVLTLLDAGLRMEPQANARVCIEHAVALQDLALAAVRGSDDLEALVEQLGMDASRRVGQQMDYLAAVDASSGGTHAGLISVARETFEKLVPGRKSGRTVRAMFDQLPGLPGGSAHLYGIYSRLSENSTHAGFGSAGPYLVAALRGGQAEPADPVAVPWAETAMLLCFSCWAAEQAMLLFLEHGGADLAARQDELMARLGFAFG